MRSSIAPWSQNSQNSQSDFRPLTGLAIGYLGDVNDLPENYRPRDLSPRQRRPSPEFVFGGKWGDEPERVEHNRKRRALMRHWKAAAAIEGSMSIDQVAALLPKIEEAEPPEARVVRPVFAGNTALKPRLVDEEEDDPHAQLTRAIFHTHGRPVLRAVPDPEDE